MSFTGDRLATQLSDLFAHVLLEIELDFLSSPLLSFDDKRSWLEVLRGYSSIFAVLEVNLIFFSRDRLGIVAEKQDQSMHPSPNSLRAPSYFTPVTLYVFFPMRLCSLNHYILIQVPTHLFLLLTRDHSENFAFRDIESSLICLAACSWPFYLNSITAWPFFAFGRLWNASRPFQVSSYQWVHSFSRDFDPGRSLATES